MACSGADARVRGSILVAFPEYLVALSNHELPAARRAALRRDHVLAIVSPALLYRFDREGPIDLVSTAEGWSLRPRVVAFDRLTDEYHVGSVEVLLVGRRDARAGETRSRAADDHETDDAGKRREPYRSPLLSRL
jgi:hypothetical protein